jgi:hypothetical protein
VARRVKSRCVCVIVQESGVVGTRTLKHLDYKAWGLWGHVVRIAVIDGNLVHVGRAYEAADHMRKVPQLHSESKIAVLDRLPVPRCRTTWGVWCDTVIVRWIDMQT